MKFLIYLNENFKMSFESIKANKMRSFLTMLGIIIGIASVIMIVSLGQGGRNSINSQFQKLGANSVNITLDTTKAVKADYFTLNDVKQIKDKVESIQYITPSFSSRGFASTEKIKKPADISAGTADAGPIKNYDMAYGRYYTEKEVEEAKPVAVIDETSALELFGYEDCIGKKFKLGPENGASEVTVIGVRKTTTIFGKRFGGSISAEVPITFLMTMYSDGKIGTLTFATTDQNDIESAGYDAKTILESRHNNRGKEIYIVDNAFKQMDQLNSVIGTFTSFIAAVAAISLLVGGIGVMNIMLVSVTERTREIGIRKAIGASTLTILAQFLTEAVIMSLTGGIIGMLLGVGLAFAIGSFVSVVPALSITVILGAILFSSAVGIFFGLYPAKKAADLAPIDALRYE